MKRWYDIYKPVIVSTRQDEEYFQSLEPDHFFKLMQPEKMKQFVELSGMSGHIEIAPTIICTEFLWLKSQKPVYFIPMQVIEFVRNTKNAHMPSDLKDIAPVVFAWHPDTKYPSCLVFSKDNQFHMHTNEHTADKHGTMTVRLRTDDDLDELGEIDPARKQVLRDLFGVLTYIQAFPELLTPGYPKDIKERCERQHKVKAVAITLHPKLAASPMSHIRRGHWRALRDPRFKRAENGMIRVVYVNPAIVGLITPYTVNGID